MPWPARLATMLMLAIHLVAASAPCPTAKLAERAPDLATLAAEAAHPCPGHPPGDPASASLDAFCPCGCQSGVAPGNGASRTGPALLVADLAVLGASDHEIRVAAPPRLTRVALPPPDHVPLAIA